MKSVTDCLSLSLPTDLIRRTSCIAKCITNNKSCKDRPKILRSFVWTFHASYVIPHPYPSKSNGQNQCKLCDSETLYLKDTNYPLPKKGHNVFYSQVSRNSFPSGAMMTRRFTRAQPIADRETKLRRPPAKGGRGGRYR